MCMRYLCLEGLIVMVLMEVYHWRKEGILEENWQWNCESEWPVIVQYKQTSACVLRDRERELET